MTKELMKERILKNLDQMLDLIYKHEPNPEDITIEITNMTFGSKEKSTTVRLGYQAHGLDTFDAYQTVTDCDIDVMEDPNPITTILFDKLEEVK